jgi:hypothetical protein
MKIFQFLRDWSEVWALLIPLIIILVYKPKGHNVKWLIFYVITAFILNFLATFILEYYYLLPSWLFNQGNNIFYNLHSFIMTIFLSWYIISIRKYKNIILLKALLGLYIVFVLLNFTLWESPILLSTRHFTAGSIVLLVMCLFYFIHSILEESQTNWLKHPSLIICSAICLYEAITFFIFLFIYPMFNKSYNKDLSFALLMMRIYQIAFVVFCILFAFALYRSKKDQPIASSK